MDYGVKSEFDSFDFLKRLSKRLKKYRYTTINAESTNGMRFAAVAVILRMRPTKPISDDELSKTVKTIEEFFNLNWVKSSVLEVLFIKRAINPKDNWSGDVAFPGGRQDKGELLVDTAKREAFEEVGINIADSSKFITLGRLDDHRASSKVALVSPFVFLQTTFTPQPLTLQTSEVAGTRWIPLSFFVTKPPSFSVKEVSWAHLTKVVPYPFLIKLVGSTFNIDKLHFPAILLPPTEDDTSSLEFLLWGLTMRITALLLTIGEKEMYYRSYTTGSVVMDSSLWIFDVFYHQKYRDREWKDMLSASLVAGAGMGAVYYLCNKAKL